MRDRRRESSRRTNLVEADGNPVSAGSTELASFVLRQLPAFRLAEVLHLRDEGLSDPEIIAAFYERPQLHHYVQPLRHPVTAIQRDLAKLKAKDGDKAEQQLRLERTRRLILHELQKPNLTSALRAKLLHSLHECEKGQNNDPIEDSADDEDSESGPHEAKRWEYFVADGDIRRAVKWRDGAEPPPRQCPPGGYALPSFSGFNLPNGYEPDWAGHVFDEIGREVGTYRCIEVDWRPDGYQTW